MTLLACLLVSPGNELIVHGGWMGFAERIVFWEP